MERYMEYALREARISLQEGNNGFGAVVVKGQADHCVGT